MAKPVSKQNGAKVGISIHAEQCATQHCRCNFPSTSPHCDLYKSPAKYFGPGEYLLADSAYASRSTVVPCYKSPAALVQ
ncbi:hypothetical protein PsorP6_004135 [Peronosclerospora sorghi]|uniref:Uncharacterized protein n=1 Tax=Peronosclerospora sorghi TaxID=230839 RepID=A0ACC0VKY5_9STRA|nr:hypothetical protein PsorP6_004135 [Peronosclerospora sorghi]